MHRHSHLVRSPFADDGRQRERGGRGVGWEELQRLECGGHPFYGSIDEGMDRLVQNNRKSREEGTYPKRV